MSHLLAPQPPLPELPVFFNVDGVVGAAPASNQREDVLLVQFLFKSIADAPSVSSDPALHTAAKAVKVTGSIDPPTISAIRLFQQFSKRFNPNTVVDGRVSPAKGGVSYGPAVWTIVHMNNILQDGKLSIWPRIDKIAGCPQEIQQMVTRTVIGK